MEKNPKKKKSSYYEWPRGESHVMRDTVAADFSYFTIIAICTHWTWVKMDIGWTSGFTYPACQQWDHMWIRFI